MAVVSKKSYGKEFEKAIQDGLSSVGSVTRLVDPTGKFAGVGNIADFVHYEYPYETWVECKSLYGNLFSVGDIKNQDKPLAGALSRNQINGLMEKSKHKGVMGAVVIWFIDHDLTIVVPIEELLAFIETSGKKSFNVKDLEREDGLFHYVLKGEKKRVMFEYDGQDFVEIVNDYHKEA